MNQTHEDWRCYVMDDESDFDVRSLCTDKRIRFFHSGRSSEERHKVPGHILGINKALDLIAKEPHGILTYLCDDDWLYPDWFQNIDLFFREKTDLFILYGRQLKLAYHKVGRSALKGKNWFPSFKAAQKPGEKLDHCQIAHRTECIADGLRWPLEFPGDRFFFDQLAKKWTFQPFDVMASQKAMHPKGLCLGGAWIRRNKEKLEGWRE